MRGKQLMRVGAGGEREREGERLLLCGGTNLNGRGTYVCVWVCACSRKGWSAFKIFPLQSAEPRGPSHTHRNTNFPILSTG